MKSQSVKFDPKKLLGFKLADSAACSGTKIDAKTGGKVGSKLGAKLGAKLGIKRGQD